MLRHIINIALSSVFVLLTSSHACANWPFQFEALANQSQPSSLILWLTYETQSWSKPYETTLYDCDDAADKMVEGLRTLIEELRPQLPKELAYLSPRFVILARPKPSNSQKVVAHAIAGLYQSQTKRMLFFEATPSEEKDKEKRATTAAKRIALNLDLNGDGAVSYYESPAPRRFLEFEPNENDLRILVFKSRNEAESLGWEMD